MRRAVILILAQLLLIGCDQNTPKTTTNSDTEPTTEPAPQPTEQTFVFDKTVTWAAYQKDGVWQGLELNKDADTLLTLAVERGGVMYLCDELSSESNSYINQSILYFENEALEKILEENPLEKFYCTYTEEIPTQPEPASAKIHGTIDGPSDKDGYHIVFRNDDHSVFAFPGFLHDAAYDYETIGGAHAGIYDAIATIFPEGASVPSKAVIDRESVTVAKEDVVYNFDLSKAVNLDSYTFNWSGLNAVESIWTSVSMNGASMGGPREGSMETMINYAAFPDGYVINPNYSIYSQATADGCHRSFWAQFQKPKNIQANPLPCIKLDFELTTNNSQPAFNLSWNYASPHQTEMIGISFEQGRTLNDFYEGSGYSVGVTFIGDFKEMKSYTLEDFSGLSGWQPTWSLKNEATIYNFYYHDQEILSDGQLQNAVSLQGIYKP